MPLLLLGFFSLTRASMQYVFRKRLKGHLPFCLAINDPPTIPCAGDPLPLLAALTTCDGHRLEDLLRGARDESAVQGESVVGDGFELFLGLGLNPRAMCIDNVLANSFPRHMGQCQPRSSLSGITSTVEPGSMVIRCLLLSVGLDDQ